MTLSHQTPFPSTKTFFYPSKYGFQDKCLTNVLMSIKALSPCLVFPPRIHAAVAIHHSCPSLRSKCLLSVPQVLSERCVDARVVSDVLVPGCVEMHADMCTEQSCDVCVCVYTSEHKPYPIHYLAGLRAAQSMALSVADELPLSDKVYHSDLSQSKTLSDILKCQ